MKQLALILALSLAAPAMADAQETRPIEINYSTNPQRCPNVSTAGLASATALSSFGVIASIPVMAGSDYAQSTGMLAGGISLAVLSTAGLIASGIYLKRKKDKKRDYQHGRCEAPVAIIPGGFRF